ncbi:general transcription factor II-I repeat domain-containing protein 2A-like [Diabrotica virgifera virgifera]|uniref:General transcription factor II-I repeat domain-containing protein 2-like n=1 Tax=Diabrotica virgifera virgifera TaxID=50390 RepID=A0ABM5KCW5_DIAVI|nr:general transcription factor II-I repeat domain-containing protein 2A-like [Diabrotica virgifera virgifera]
MSSRNNMDSLLIGSLFRNMIFMESEDNRSLGNNKDSYPNGKQNGASKENSTAEAHNTTMEGRNTDLSEESDFDDKIADPDFQNDEASYPESTDDSSDSSANTGHDSNNENYTQQFIFLTLDESTDQTHVSQLLIFVRTTFDDFTSKEELFDICPLYGTTKGKDIYEAVKKTVDRIGGFDKCSAIATDGAPSMTGKKIGLVGLLRENGVTCPIIHCIIHQEALCGKSVKEDQVFQTVIKIVNMIRGGNRSLLHRQLKQFLVETEAEYGDLLMYNHVRWLSAGKCMERFFAIRKEIPAFLNKYVSSDTTELEEEFKDPEFLRQLAFITDLTNHLNMLNLSLQGRNQTVSDLIGMINGFRNTLNVFKRALEKNNLTHFPSCLQIAEEFNGEQFTN